MPTGRSVAIQRLHSVLCILGVDWTVAVSVCVDVAAATCGCTGVQAKCKGEKSNVLCVHCCAYYQNLVLLVACTSSEQNRVVFDFFRFNAVPIRFR